MVVKFGRRYLGFIYEPVAEWARELIADGATDERIERMKREVEQTQQMIEKLQQLRAGA